jgi:hypothetical protein
MTSDAAVFVLLVAIVVGWLVDRETQGPLGDGWSMVAGEAVGVVLFAVGLKWGGQIRRSFTASADNRPGKSR